MKKPLLLSIFIGSLLQANMGTLLIIPQDANIVMGIYSGLSHTSTTTEIESTNNIIDGQTFNFDNNVVVFGTMVGVQNDYYRFSFSYDTNSDSDVELQRALMNFDFKIGEKKGLRPLVGFGVGVAMNSYNINNKNIKQENGLLAFRAGAEYCMDKSKSIEILLEYSHLIESSVGKSFYEASDFTTYNIKGKNDFILRVGYSFEF